MVAPSKLSVIRKAAALARARPTLLLSCAAVRIAERMHFSLFSFVLFLKNKNRNGGLLCKSREHREQKHTEQYSHLGRLARFFCLLHSYLSSFFCSLLISTSSPSSSLKPRFQRSSARTSTDLARQTVSLCSMMLRTTLCGEHYGD